MDILPACVGLVIAFIIIMFFLLCCLIYTRIKVILITVSIWYSLILFYIPQQFMGWPTSQTMPDEIVVFSSMVREPSFVDDGVIYLWVINYAEYKKSLLKFITPQFNILHSNKFYPRAYKLPYDRDFHRKLIENKAKEGACLIIRSPHNNPEFRVDDPRNTLTK